MNENTAIKDKKKPAHLAKKSVEKKSAVAADTVSAPVKKKKKMDPKKKKRITVIVVIVVILAVLFLLFKACSGGAMQSSGLTLADTTVLKYGDIEDSFSTNGTVESAKSMSVYSTLAYTTMTVDVKVGDVVTEGQLLCQLDGNSIQKQIDTQQASKNDTAATTYQQIKSAQDTYDAAKKALENGENASIISAQSQVDTTLANYNKATETYNRYRDSMSGGTNATLLNQEAALQSSKAQVESAQDSYDSAIDDRILAYDNWHQKSADLTDARNSLNSLKSTRSTMYSYQAEIVKYTDLYNKATTDAEREEYQKQIDFYTARLKTLGDVATIEAQITSMTATVSSLETAETTLHNTYNSAENRVIAAGTTLDNAKESYKIVKKQYNATLQTIDNTLADYATAVDTAADNYNTAVESLQAAKTAADNQLVSYQNALNSAKAGAGTTTSDVNLRNLRADLSDTSITAPMAGTVTAVYAEVGKSGSGLLFVIEDVGNLVVETTVKDYDVGSVFVGMPVTVKSDSLKDKRFEGAVSSVAPAAKKNAAGETDAAAGAVYETEVQVLTADSGLKIGMEARLSYIIAQEQNVLTVPYEAVYENDAGKSCVLAAELQENGKYLLREIEVTKGMENDLDIVISGDAVTEGLRIINEPTSYIASAGKAIDIAEHQSAQQAMMGMMGG